jgi:hypothetical protein
MTKPLAAALLLPLCLGVFACAAQDDETTKYEDLAADLAEHVGIESYEIVVVDDETRDPAERLADDSPDESPNASFPDDFAADDDPTELKCRMTGWIGHTPVCRVCTVDLGWVCMESIDCFDGGGPTYRSCNAGVLAE